MSLTAQLVSKFFGRIADISIKGACGTARASLYSMTAIRRKVQTVRYSPTIPAPGPLDLSLRRSLSATALLGALTLVGCFTPRVRLDELPEDRSLEVVLDANRTFTFPGCRIKFFVDIFNRTNARIDLDDLDVRVNAAPPDDRSKIALTKQWGFQWSRPVTIEPGKKITLPIRPKVTAFNAGAQHDAYGRQSSRVYASDFPIEQLQPGGYFLTAVINDRFVSKPRRLEVRPRPESRNIPVPPEAARIRGAHETQRH